MGAEGKARGHYRKMILYLNQMTIEEEYLSLKKTYMTGRHSLIEQLRKHITDRSMTPRNIVETLSVFCGETMSITITEDETDAVNGFEVYVYVNDGDAYDDHDVIDLFRLLLDEYSIPVKEESSEREYSLNRVPWSAFTP